MVATINKKAWFVWAIAIVFVIFQFTQQLSAGVMAHVWTDAFHLDAISLSYLSSSFYYGYLLLQIPAGLLFDSYGPRKVLTGAAITIGIGCIALALAKTYYIALFARFVMGMGATFAFVGMLCLVSEWFPTKKFAFMVSLSETTGMLITSITVLVLAWMVAEFSWRIAMDINGIIAFAVTACVLIFIKDKPHDQTDIGLDKPKISAQLKTVFGNRDIWLCGMFGFFTFAFLTTFASLWGVPYLRNSYHMSLHLATNAATMTLIGIAAGGPLLSTLSDKLGKRKPIMVISSFIAFILSLCLFASNSWPIWLVYLLIFLISVASSSYIISFAVAKEISTRRVSGTAMAAINLIIMTSGIILQPLIGWLIHTNINNLSNSTASTYQLSMLLFPVGFLFATGLAMLTCETHCQSLDEISFLK